ncbi:MAG: PTS sugar transporter subunit IIA [Candidatus Cloacimonetes bacterium]|nr:PTS sugar transporter subunit IIA [Candidatus Cloacimonadota bacterium]
MNLANVVKLECCEINFSARNKDDALKKISKILMESSQLKQVDEDSIYQSLLERENKGSTGFNKGIAIPHCQIEGIKEFIISIAICKKGINFDSLDKKKSRIFITIVGPSGDRSDHLKLLAKVSQILRMPGVSENLLNTTTKIGLYEEFLRNTENGVDVALKKEQDKLMLLIVRDEDVIQDITEVFVEIGVQDSTIIETQQMENLLSKAPLFMGFFDFTGGKQPFSKIILLKIPKDYINAIIKGIESTVGDLETYSGVSIMVLDLFFAKGF